jgi:RimJ/RimL family protein N-acetyltransferase
MQEAIQTIIDYAFNEMKLNYLLAVFHPDNKPSIRLLERNNFILNTDAENTMDNLIVYQLNKNS